MGKLKQSRKSHICGIHRLRIKKRNKRHKKNTRHTTEKTMTRDTKRHKEKKQEKDKGNKKEGITRKRVRRSKRIKNTLSIYYQNVRGLKSKLDSLPEMIDDYQPTLICIVETHMQKEEEIQIPGYRLAYRNNRSANSGGILIGVRDNIKNISSKLTQENKVAKVFGY